MDSGRPGPLVPRATGGNALARLALSRARLAVPAHEHADATNCSAERYRATAKRTFRSEIAAATRSPRPTRSKSPQTRSSQDRT
jgi:hypothetical protein